MKERIEKMNWNVELDLSKKDSTSKMLCFIDLKN